MASSVRRYLRRSTTSDWRRVCRLWVVCMLVLMVAVLGVWPVADAGYERACSVDELRGRRAGVCGSRLVDLLRAICRSCYNKRSADCESSIQ